jgi:hypothetical protein
MKLVLTGAVSRKSDDAPVAGRHAGDPMLKEEPSANNLENE